jgi:regulator of PEP synthase PpsR (kinase-PPPase family)
MGIIQLHRHYGSERLNNACRRAVFGQAISYTRIKNILENKLDSDSADNQKEYANKSHIPAHANIRGAQAFK